MTTKLIPALLFASAAIPALAAEKLNVVYHVSEAEKVAFVVGNIQNHIDGVGGPENVHIVLVAHGPAVNAFNDIEATDRVRSGLAKLNDQGVELAMCGNTLKGFGVSLD